MLTTEASLADGINRHIVMISSALNARSGIEVAVTTTHGEGDFCTELQKRGIKVYALGCQSGHSLALIWRFLKVMRTFKPDIVHIHVLPLMERILLSVAYKNKTYIRTVHGFVEHKGRITMRMCLEKWFCRIFKVPCDAIIYISNGVRDGLPKSSSRVIVDTIYNPLPESVPLLNKSCSGKLHHVLGLSQDIPIIGTICRVATVKNLPVFVDVMRNVLQVRPDVHAVLIGDGDPIVKSSIINLVRQYNISDRFHFLGYRADAKQLLCEFSCFVMTSLSEGFPTALLEAISAKVPIAFMKGNGGLKDLAKIHVAEGPIGIVCNIGDVNQMASDICLLLDNPSQAQNIAERAYETCMRYFSLESVAKKLHELYDRCLKKRGRQ